MTGKDLGSMLTTASLRAPRGFLKAMRNALSGIADLSSSRADVAVAGAIVACLCEKRLQSGDYLSAGVACDDLISDER